MHLSRQIFPLVLQFELTQTSATLAKIIVRDYFHSYSSVTRVCDLYQGNLH